MTFISLTLYKGPHFIKTNRCSSGYTLNMRVTFLILLLVAMIVVASARWGSDSSFSDTGRREKTDSGTSRRRTTSSESSPGRPVSPDRRRRLVTPDRRRRRVDRDCGFPPCSSDESACECDRNIRGFWSLLLVPAWLCSYWKPDPCVRREWRSYALVG